MKKIQISIPESLTDEELKALMWTLSKEADQYNLFCNNQYSFGAKDGHGRIYVSCSVDGNIVVEKK